MSLLRIAPRLGGVTRPHPYSSIRSFSPIPWDNGKRATARAHSRTPKTFAHRVPISFRTFIKDGKGPAVSSSTAPPFAFAFDIDGVLLHVAKPIPGAIETLKYLQQHSIPFILLTNGGGKYERDRVEDLSNRLGVPLSIDNFVQSHTPFQELVHASWAEDDVHGHKQTELRDVKANSGLADKNILVTGSDANKSRRIAEAYGFRSVITPADVLVADPTIFPFEPLLESHYKATARPLPSPNPKIDAIFVFNDPRDWALDTQIILDLLLSQNGVLGTYSSKNGRAEHQNHGWQQDGQPDLYFSNHDLFWSATYHLPRFGQGAFQAALAGIWRQITNDKAELKRTTIGKPYSRTYSYAERVLGQWRAGLLKDQGDAADAPETETETETETEPAPLARVYMVGDNPESDIQGANDYISPQGTEWNSVLVRTGVWNEERDGEPRHKPDAIVPDVMSAVEWALKREGWR
ncbi:HAD-superfamily subfamily IIA hydrolase [Poronia punctata]|nr:HAD-superfamily subfamily IIA hydrolase [Poronia punctata]